MPLDDFPTRIDVLNRAGIGTWSWDLRNDVMCWDTLFASLLGLSGASDTGSVAQMIERVLEEDRGWVRDLLVNVPQANFNCSVRVLHADNTVHYITIVGSRSEKLIEGVVQSADTLQDWQRREATFRTIVASALNDAMLGMWTWEPAQDKLTWDTGMHRIFKVEIGQFAGHLASLCGHLHAEDIASFRLWMSRAREAGTDHHSVIEMRVLHPDTSIHWVRCTMRVIDNPYGAGIFVFGTAQLIDDQRERENDLMRSNRELEQFAYVASHDLQEPLRNISHFVQKILGSLDTLSEDQQRWLEHVNNGSDRMLKMIRGLLEYSRVDSKGSAFAVYDLRPTLLATQEDLQTLLNSRGGELDVSGVPDFQLCGDRSQVARLFMNLVQNAVRYTRVDVSPRIVVTAERSGGRILVRFKDNGIGIEERHWARIFFTFKQLDPTSRSDGVGIGLTICQRIAARHGGSIRVESSKLGVGSVFLVTLPESLGTCEEDN